jgi:hypothetical protein
MNAFTNRRSLLSGALTAGAAATVAAIPAMAAAESADPVFAAMEAHKAAWARLLETKNRTDDFDTLEAFHALEAAGGAVDAAFEELTQTSPTTRPGMRAFLEYVHDWIGESGYYYDPRLLLRSPLLAG